jgi:putative phosphoesterase
MSPEDSSIMPRPTRVAALYDIHGNLPALDAVLREVRAASVDLVVSGGDVAFGPMPRECMTRLVTLDVPVRFVSGNCDRAVLQRLRGIDAGDMPESYRGLTRWVAGQIPNHEAALASWPATVKIDIAGIGPVLFCHATPRNDVDVFTRLTLEDRLRPLFDQVGAPTVICGHSHMQFDRTIGTTRVINAGSVGMSFQGPGAFWLLLGPSVQLRRTAYDLKQAADIVRDTRYPQAEEFATRNILDPPSEASMLDAFSRIELKS